MLFSSMTFLWIFLPIVIIGNALINFLLLKNPKKRIKIKNIFLLISSLIFYAWGGFYYVFIMIFSILINFYGGFLIDIYGNNAYFIQNKPKEKKKIFVITIFLNLFILFIFKYFNMMIATVESIMEGGNFITVLSNIISLKGTGKLNFPQIVLPIGISFFTFQSMSYVCDVYMGKTKVQKSIVDFALYVALFPQLIAGPIVQYSDIDAQLKYRDENLDKYFEGLRRFLYGISKKVLIANNVALVADNIFALNPSEISTLVAWLGSICYMIQIYFDFSGYSDMAIGLGHMFGFTFKENFNYPYTALSMQDFWRRWHISLSTWFRDYVYIPLGGSRKGLFKTLRNTFIVFLLTGIWHGANWTFIIWGIMHGIALIIEKIGFKKILDNNPFKFLNWLYVNIFVLITFTLFRADNYEFFQQYFHTLFNFQMGNTKLLSFIDYKCFYALVFGILFSGYIQKWFAPFRKEIRKKFALIEMVILFVLFTFCIMQLVSGTYNPFIYFQF